MMKKKLMVYLFLGVGLMGLFLFTPDMVYAAGSGVTELDNAATKTNTYGFRLISIRIPRFGLQLSVKDTFSIAGRRRKTERILRSTLETGKAGTSGSMSITEPVRRKLLRRGLCYGR